MARPIPCDICNEHVADFMIHDTRTGNTLGVGEKCLSVFAERVVSRIDAFEANRPEWGDEIDYVLVGPPGAIAVEHREPEPVEDEPPTDIEIQQAIQKMLADNNVTAIEWASCASCQFACPLPAGLPTFECPKCGQTTVLTPVDPPPPKPRKTRAKKTAEVVEAPAEPKSEAEEATPGAQPEMVEVAEETAPADD